MKLIIENIGMIRQAEIDLYSLCVIAGENDNGKSTIGKIVFCILKAVNRYKEDLRESKDYWINEKLNEIYFFLRTNLKIKNSSVTERMMLLRSHSFSEQISSEQWPVFDELINELIHTAELNIEQKEHVIQLQSEIKELVAQPENQRKAIENAFNKIFASEFDSSLLLQGASKGYIQLLDNNITLIHLEIDQHNGVTLLSEIEPIELKDATFIDSALVLNYHDVLIRSQTLLDIDKRRLGNLGMAYTTLHTKDLFDKLRNPILPNSLFDIDKTELLSKLHNIVNGEIAYDKNVRDFVFRRNQEDISIKNTASGIKVFGLLQILIANDFISKNSMLVFDEPENHLHPKWQLKLAEFLVSLAKNGIYILLSSHSPYMIEALKRYGDQAGLAKKSRFFLAENRCIKNEDRLGEIFQVLAEPFEVFRKMDAEVLRGE